ncbi:MAG TPA: DUF1990 family protein, partial [Actinomycetota bacterium]|nr:DUF1990 family protein [Actinomycetota bacterium]
MFLSSKPDEATIREFLSGLASAPLSYEPLGLCRMNPEGYNVDVHRVRIGTGESDLETAKQALDSFAGVRLGWADVFPEKPTAELGSNVVVIASHMGFWSLNGCRIVSRLPSDEDPRYGFCYGTLREHAEIG